MPGPPRRGGRPPAARGDACRGIGLPARTRSARSSRQRGRQRPRRLGGRAGAGVPTGPAPCGNPRPGPGVLAAVGGAGTPVETARRAGPALPVCRFPHDPAEDGRIGFSTRRWVAARANFL